MDAREFERLQFELYREFTRYLLQNEKEAADVPDNAVICFILEDNEEFNARSRELAESIREPDQPLVVVNIKGLAPSPPSRLIEPVLKTVA
jgi:hypothetical protein